MLWRIEIKHKKGVFDPLAESVLKSIEDLGLKSVSRVEITHVYNLEGELPAANVQTVCRDLLVDVVTQDHDYALQKS